MRLFEGLFHRYIVDADGRPRRLYRLRWWWCSPGVRAEIPRQVYDAICAAAHERNPTAEAEAAWRPPVPGRRWRSSSTVVWILLIIVALTTRSWTLLMLMAAAFLLISLDTVLSLLPRRVRAAWTRLFGRPLVWSDAELILAMVACGRCPSCAYELDLTSAREGTAFCPECGARWFIPRPTPAASPPASAASLPS